MKSRIISGIIMAVILFFILYIGGIVFDIATAILAVGVYKELLDVKKERNIPTIMKIVGMIGVLVLVLNNINDHVFRFGLSYEALSLFFLLILIPTLFLRNKNYKTEDAFYLSSVTMFTGVIFNLFIMIYNESIYQLIFIILIACITDIFALFGGILIGKHKLTSISPKKTIEGSIVGTMVAIIVATTYYIIFISTEGLAMIIPVIALLSVIGQMGDLFFSLIKRENGVKDYSNLIPGHGGILDRIDSIIFILIAFVFIMQFM